MQLGRGTRTRGWSPLLASDDYGALHYSSAHRFVMQCKNQRYGCISIGWANVSASPGHSATDDGHARDLKDWMVPILSDATGLKKHPRLFTSFVTFALLTFFTPKPAQFLIHRSLPPDQLSSDDPGLLLLSPRMSLKGMASDLQPDSTASTAYEKRAGNGAVTHRDSRNNALNKQQLSQQAPEEDQIQDDETEWVYSGLDPDIPRRSFAARIRGFTFAWFALCMSMAGFAILVGRIPDAYRCRGIQTLGDIIFVVDLVL